ncbi:MAG: dipicolinate synthase subunit DpsA [Firmicutes bacterium]|nr:dipicolinate synthase subunit DpsA [Bacillota bacterium]MDD4791513.1 dipicolinate synthase subunit DpsA [Bacillota bacterium]
MDHVANLKGRHICLLGGDRRELKLVCTLIDSGAKVSCYGVPGDGLRPEAIVAESAEQACRGANVVVLPLSGTDSNGNVKVASKPICITRELLSVLSPNAILFSGTVPRFLAAESESLGIRTVETTANDELAILNSIPSAEGAILMAMQATPFTIHNSNCLVLGLGRTGLTLARMLQGIGAHVWAAARKGKDRARAFEMGLSPLDFADLSSCLPQIDIVFNTVPALVLDRALTYTMKRTAVIIDLASAPGGVDFVAASERGIHAELAPGLPGRVAPITAGQIVSKVLPEMIAAELARDEWER